MKFLAATFPGNQRAKICENVRRNSAAFFAGVSETFRQSFALGNFHHKRQKHDDASAIKMLHQMSV